MKLPVFIVWGMFGFVNAQTLPIELPSIPQRPSQEMLNTFLRAEPIFPTIPLPQLPFPGITVPSRVDKDVDVSSQAFEPTEGCSWNITGLNVGDNGNVTTPNYPEDYPNNEECVWIIESQPGTKIKATMFDLLTEPWFFVYFDYVLVCKNGTFDKCDKMAGDLNDNLPTTFESVDNKIAFRFVSSRFSSWRGLKVEYLVVPGNNVTNTSSSQPSPYDGVCGTSFILNSTSNSTSRIIGNNPAPPHAYPWMAALLINNQSFCGGSVIDSQHILTAAHCTDGAEFIDILLGSHNIKAPSSEEPSRQVFHITSENIYQHPKYQPDVLLYDISILKLPTPLQFSDTIKPICIPNRYYMPENYIGQGVGVSGWGIQSDNAKSISPQLQHVFVNVTSNANARRTFGRIVTGNNICIATTPTKSPCRGDSGGPLFIRQSSPTGDYIMQMGIVSFGTNTCQRGNPVAFTRTTAFLDYIDEITGRDSGKVA